ncbi:MAG: hypothetical protein KAR87_02100 [Candidatus Aenigmarchaeota archaeon]|nr:hypothetical protein [Candidatus Aenigmarchaeota archaeon]
MTKNKDNFNGAIIEESLTNPKILERVHITKTEILPVTKRHKTPWVKQWTFHFVEVEEKKADSIAEEISKNMNPEHAGYADFKNKQIF